MAKIRSGIIGNLKGNISTVNAGVLNSSGYLRSRWFDQTPENSSSKQLMINGFTDTANIWKFFADPFLRFLWYNTYNPAVGYHKFMKLNVPLIARTFGDPYTAFKPFDGPLSPPTVTNAFVFGAIGIRVVYTSPSLITKQSDPTDTIVYMMWNQSKTIFSFGSVDRNRSNSNFTVAPELTGEDTPITIKVGFTPFRSAFNMSPTSRWTLHP